MTNGYRKAKGGTVNIDNLYRVVEDGIQIADVEGDVDKMRTLKAIRRKLERGSYHFTSKERYIVRTVLREIAEPAMIGPNIVDREHGTLAFQQAQSVGFDAVPERASGDRLDEGAW